MTLETIDDPPSTVCEHSQHVVQPLGDADDEFLVAPPECGECGFGGFDYPLDSLSN